MRIKQLKIKNFRGFGDLTTVNFEEKQAGLAVFVGVNGAGKTSVLDAIANLLLNFTKDVLIEGTIRNMRLVVNEVLLDKDVNKRTDLSDVCEISCSCELPVKQDGILLTNNTRFGGSNVFSTKLHDFLIAQFDDIRALFNQNNWNNIPVLCYYSTNRLVEDNPSLKPKDISLTKPFDVWKDSFRPIVDFNELFEWYRNTEDIENQKRLRENNSFRHKGLELVRKILPTFLDGFSNPYVNREGGEELTVQKDNLELSISNLSQGERMILAITWDLVRRLSIANSNLENPLLGTGIVLIDEIEQHLHPKWQREIIPNLRNTFKNIQFILTTHSPQVLSNVPRENVFILDNFKIQSVHPHTEGRDSNSILWDIFGVEKRPLQAKEEFEKLYRLMDDPEKEAETENLLHKMEEKYGYYDEEIVRARSHFQFLNEA